MLHIVNKSFSQTNALASCLRLAKSGHALLLTEDAVYAATTGTAWTEQVRQACAKLKVYALQPDLDARGLTAKLIDGVSLVDYGGFVDLTVQHPTSHAWL